MKKKIKNHQPHGLSRRQLLSMLGWGGLLGISEPLNIFKCSFVDSLINSAQAQSIGMPKNYVAILFSGAPTRWVWDSFLRPNGNDAFVENASVKNYITSKDTYTGDNSQTSWISSKITLPDGESIYLPYVWTTPIPVSDGGSVPMSSLLNNTMIIRGVNMGADIGHKLGPGRVTRPNLGAISLTGAIADRTNDTALIQAVGLTKPYQGYKSAQNTGISLALSSSPLVDLLSGIDNSSTIVKSGLSRFRSIESEKEDVMSALAEYAKTKQPGSDILLKNRVNAEKLFKKNFGDLNDAFKDLSDKYAQLERRCATEAINYILPNSGVNGYTLAGGFSTGLARQFAVAEFLISQGLSSSITMGGTANSRVAGMTVFHDEHRQPDRQQSIIVRSFEFRALSAFLYEFRRSLGPTVWNNTVVHIGSEFDRLPSNDNLGTDHAAHSNVMTVMSGAIKKPIFMGNILTNKYPNDSMRSGTYGAAAPVQTDFGQTEINNKHTASTVATLLGIPSPVREKSLIKIENGNVIPLAEKPKNVG